MGPERLQINAASITIDKLALATFCERTLSEFIATTLVIEGSRDPNVDGEERHYPAKCLFVGASYLQEFPESDVATQKIFELLGGRKVLEVWVITESETQPMLKPKSDSSGSGSTGTCHAARCCGAA